MRLDHIFDVATWNRDRGNAIIHAAVDFDLEIRMLSEEKNEFYVDFDALVDSGAEPLSDIWHLHIARMADAIADFQFVYAGTVAKVSRAKMTMPDVRQAASLAQFVQNEMNIMIQLFLDLTSPYVNVNLDECLDIVIDANDKKGTEKVNGKIQKGPDWVDPITTIEKYIRSQVLVAEGEKAQ